MAFPDRRLEGPFEPPDVPTENRQDVIPPHERNQDPERSTHDLVTEVSRPLTEDEHKAADRDAPAGERVYAPASERVPREPVPGHRDFVEHPDTHTPEREAEASQTVTEPSFARVPRPSTTGFEGEYQDEQERWISGSPAAGGPLPISMGWVTLCVSGAVGVWLWTRWQRERNKPINRIRRQAKQTAAQARQTATELRERMPELPDEATRPALGLGTALLSLAVVLWQQSQSRSRMDEARSRIDARKRWGRKEASRRADKASREAMKFGRRAAQTVSDVDWQQRLEQLLDHTQSVLAGAARSAEARRESIASRR
jgi:hypothetical protein